MKYSCVHCPYESDKKANYLRHLNRKFRCNKSVHNDEKNNLGDEKNNLGDENNNLGDEKNNLGDEKNNLGDEKNNLGDENNNLGDEKNNLGDENNNFVTTIEEDKNNFDSIFIKCTQCDKVVTIKYFCNHLKICRGVPKNTCKFCFRSFNKQQGCSKHQKICRRNPDKPSLIKQSFDDKTNFVETSIGEQINIDKVISSNNQVINNSNNNNNTVNNIIHFNSFGDEGIEQLGKFLSGQKDDSKIIERMRQIGKKKMYGVREMQNDIFFNPDNPKGFSIIKPDKYGSKVRVRNSDGEFEYMEFSDVRDPLLNYIEKYIDIYNKTRNKYNVKFKDPKERRILYDFFTIMNDDLDIYLGEDLKEDLNIRDNSSEKSETIRYKQFDQVSLDNIHVQTKKFFRCQKGEFILRRKEEDTVSMVS